ncbi:hypothetical protein [Mycobacterium aquaticum]|nr:hypothetical protein [Mycobacterium aquaticum]
MTTRFMLIATAAAFAAMCVVSPAVAAADTRVHLQTPSGNIRCVLDISSTTDAPVALCQISDHTYVAGPSRDETTGAACPMGNAGRDFRLDAGRPAFLRCSYAALDGGAGVWETADDGQATSLGPITCVSEAARMTCTDTDSGHFFRVSPESYQLG